jgi:hypothetical protein
MQAQRNYRLGNAAVNLHYEHPIAKNKNFVHSKFTFIKVFAIFDGYLSKSPPPTNKAVLHNILIKGRNLLFMNAVHAGSIQLT